MQPRLCIVFCVFNVNYDKHHDIMVLIYNLIHLENKINEL